MAKIGVYPIAGYIGAEIEGVDLAKPLDNETFAAVHQALLDHLVIFFHDQTISPDQHVAFAARFGEIDLKPFVRPLELKTVAGYPQILEIVKEASDHKINFGGVWHHDVTYRVKPNLGSVLVAREVPSHGGDTMWANQYLAYDALSDEMKKQIADLRAVHTSVRGYDPQRYAEAYKVKIEQLDEAAIRRSIANSDQEENDHPVVRTHPETGRKCLFVNRSYTVRFKGMTDEESRPLLNFLCDHAVRPEFTCRFRWKPGSVAMWDNRACMHYALNDYHGQRRVMHRIAIHGDRPV